MSYIKHRKERKVRKEFQLLSFAFFAPFAVSAHGLPNMPLNINIKLTQAIQKTKTINLSALFSPQL